MERDRIILLKSGESTHIDLGMDAGVEIWRIRNYFFLFSIPLFGGEPVFERKYRTEEVDKMIEYYESWT